MDAAAAMIVGICHNTVLSHCLRPVRATETPANESVITAVLDSIA